VLQHWQQTHHLEEKNYALAGLRTAQHHHVYAMCHEQGSLTEKPVNRRQEHTVAGKYSSMHCYNMNIMSP
jgi:hypothetical protein